MEKKKYNYESNACPPHERLAHAIVVRAVQDYSAALRRLERKNGDDPYAEIRMKEIETFFRSDWFSMLTTLDGEWLVEEIERLRSTEIIRRVRTK